MPGPLAIMSRVAPYLSWGIYAATLRFAQEARKFSINARRTDWPRREKRIAVEAAERKTRGATLCACVHVDAGGNALSWLLRAAAAAAAAPDRPRKTTSAKKCPVAGC